LFWPRSRWSRGRLCRTPYLSSIFDTRRLSRKLPKVVQPSAPHLAVRHHLDPVDAGRVQRKRSLYAYTVGDLADGERRAVRAVGPANDHPLEHLDPLLLTLDDFHVDPHGIPGFEIGHLGLELLGFDLVDEVCHGHAFSVPSGGSS